MNVGELKELLKDLDDTMLVVLSRDGEGNAYSTLADYSIGFYIAEDDYIGDFVTEEEADDDKHLNLDGSDKAILLWPSN